MKKLIIAILFLTIWSSSFGQADGKPRHDQLKTPLTGNTDSLIYFKRNAVGWELVKDILTTSRVVGLDTFVQSRINISGGQLISEVEDTLTYYLLKQDFQDSLNNYLLTFFDTTGFTLDTSHLVTRIELGDTTAILRDSLLNHLIRIQALEELDIVEFADLSGIRDSLLASFDSLAVHLDSIQAHNLRLIDLEEIDHSAYLLKANFGDSLGNYKLTDIDSVDFRLDASQIENLPEAENYWDLRNDTLSNDYLTKIDSLLLADSKEIEVQFISVYTVNYAEASSKLSTDGGSSFTTSTVVIASCFSTDGSIHYRMKKISPNIIIEVSFDYGVTFSEILRIALIGSEIWMDCSSDGSVFALYYYNSGSKVHVSKDFGETFILYQPNNSYGIVAAGLDVAPEGDWVLFTIKHPSLASLEYSRIDVNAELMYQNVEQIQTQRLFTYCIGDNGTYYYVYYVSPNWYLRQKPVDQFASLILTSAYSIGKPYFDEHSGYVYFSDFLTMKKFHKDTVATIRTVNTLPSVGTLPSVWDMAVAKNGDIYVADGNNNLIRALNGESTYTTILSGVGSNLKLNSGFSKEEVKIKNNSGDVTVSGSFAMTDSYSPRKPNELIDLKYFQSNYGNLRFESASTGVGYSQIRKVRVANMTIGFDSEGVITLTATSGGETQATNLGTNYYDTYIGLTSSTGGGTSISGATTSVAGVMTASDKTKLDGIATNANNYALPQATTSVLGGVKPDGTTITVTNGVISATGSGMVYPSGSGIPTINSGSWGTTISPSTGYLQWNGSAYVWDTPSSGGDMFKATYDTNSNNIVDNSEALGGVAASSYATLTGSQALTNKSVNGVTLATNQGTTNFLRGDGSYAAIAGSYVTTNTTQAGISPKHFGTDDTYVMFPNEDRVPIYYSTKAWTSGQDNNASAFLLSYNWSGLRNSLYSYAQIRLNALANSVVMGEITVNLYNRTRSNYIIQVYNFTVDIGDKSSDKTGILNLITTSTNSTITNTVSSVVFNASSGNLIIGWQALNIEGESDNILIGVNVHGNLMQY